MFSTIAGGPAVRVINVHLDYASRDNRQKSVALILDKVQAWTKQGETVFLVGYLNARAQSSLVGSLETAGFAYAEITDSICHFNRDINLFGAIDHLAVNGDAKVAAGPWVLHHRWDDVWPMSPDTPQPLK